MLCRKILALCLCLMTAGSALASPADSLEVKRPKAKWRGGATVEAGSNFHLDLLGDRTHDTGIISANTGFTKGKFDMDLAAKFANEHKITGKAGGNVRIADNDTTLRADASVNDRKTTDTESSLNLKWHPGCNLYKAYYNFRMTGAIPYNYNLTTVELGEEDFLYDYSLESGSANTYRHRPGISMERAFPCKDRILYAGIDTDIYSSRTYSVWSTGTATSDYETYSVTGHTEESKYRQTPSSRYYECQAEVRYSDKKLFGVRDLKADFALRAKTKLLNEHMSAATYVNGHWKDSTSARENFIYTTLSLIPLIHVNFKRGIYTLDFTSSPEYFAYKLDGDGHKGTVNEGEVAALMDMSNVFKPWDRHTFTLKLKRTDERPNYQQICWFPRYSSIYANEIYKGNPDLENSVTTDSRLSYDYAAKRFSVGLELTDVFKPCKIEKTFSNETIRGKEFRVYTWINGGESNEIIARLHSKWKSDNLTIGLSAKYRYFHGYSASGSETKSSDYSFSGNWSYVLKTWKFESNAAYQSDLNRNYYSISSVIDGDFKVSKTFGKHFTVYIYGQDLLDKPLLVETKSADEKEIRYEKMLSNKRLLKLGVTYKF